MAGSKKGVETGSPPEGPYIIRTGFHFDDERTSRRFEILMCSVEQTGSSWLEEETVIGNRQRLSCRRGDLVGVRAWEAAHDKTHGKTHEVISLREAAEWGVLDVADGCVLIANDELLRTLARRIA